MSERHEPIPATDCVKAWGIFASFDGNAPDTDDIILVSSQALAEQVIPHVRERYNATRTVDGWENWKTWACHATVAERKDVLCSFDEACQCLYDNYDGQEYEEGSEDESDE